jgi:hypothetical protein
MDHPYTNVDKMGEEERKLTDGSAERNKFAKPKTEDVFKSMNFFKRLKLIKGTLSKLRERTSFRKLIFVKNHQLKIIQDYTYDIDNRKDNDPLIYLKPKVKNIFKT